LVTKNDLRHDLRRRAVKTIGHGFHIRKMLGNHFHELRMIQISGSGDDHVTRRKSLAIKIKHRSAVEFLDRVASAKDRPTQGMILPEILGKDFVDEVIGIVFAHLDLFENHAALAADVLRIENRIQHQVAENIERDWNVLIQHLDAEADALLGGEGVHVSADGINLTRDFFCSSMLGTLENHVLDEMRNAIPG